MDSAVKLMPEYVAALCKELEILGKIVREIGTKIDTVYFGGGTPTSISAEDIRRIMESVAQNFDLDSIREYSFEAGRPDTITEEKLRVIKELGADRISVNPQTLNDDVLRVIGRRHSGKDAIKAFELARKIGFDNINTDLIAGLPTESTESFRNTLIRYAIFRLKVSPFIRLRLKDQHDFLKTETKICRILRQKWSITASIS